MVVVENGVDGALFRPLSGVEEIRERLGLRGHFVVSYVGTIGFAHGLDVVLDVAAALRARCPEILFLLVGDGAERERLEARARAEGLTNVRFTGQRPRAEMPAYIAASDVCLVLLRDSELFKGVLPSKMLEFMACARPPVVGVAGLAAQLIAQSGGGICVKPGDAEDLAEAVERLYQDEPLRTKLGEAGRRFVRERFTRAAKARRYVQALRELVPS
jgi:glycosyltransferase involved in cell wall biosynthesis